MAAELSTFDAEVGVAGAILRDSDSYSRVAAYLSEGSFMLEAPRMIFHAAAVLEADGKTIEPIPIRELLKQEGFTLSNRTMMEYMEVTPTSANDVLYAEFVRKYALRRSARELATRILEDEESDPEELAANAARDFEDLAKSQRNGSLAFALERMSGFYQGMENQEVSFLSTGFPALDGILGGGLHKGRLYIIGARPGVGKTSFALNLADNLSAPVMFVSLEMTEDEITRLQVARRTKITTRRLERHNNLTEAEFDRIAAATSGLCKSGIAVNRCPSATVAEIGCMARGVKGLGAVFVDYLGLITAANPGKSRYETITDISRDLKKLALSLNVPVVVLAQLNRAVESRQDKRPSLADLRDSGAIEQDANVVMLLSHYSGRDEIPVQIECEIAKNRHGPLGSDLFQADLATCSFEEMM